MTRAMRLVSHWYSAELEILHRVDSPLTGAQSAESSNTSRRGRNTPGSDGGAGDFRSLPL